MTPRSNYATNDMVVSFQDCLNSHLNGFLETLTLLPFFVTGVFSALRAYALLGRGLFVSGVVLFLGLVPAVTNAYGFIGASYVYFDMPATGSTCKVMVSPNITPTISLAQWNTDAAAVAVTTRVAVIVADIIILIITWKKTFSTIKHANSIGVDVSISATVLRDGSVYFMIMLGLNIFQVICNTVSVDEYVAVPTILADIMSPLLISRFLINLRQDDGIQEHESGTKEASHTTTVDFRRHTVHSMIGNMGESLDDGMQDTSDEYLEDIEATTGELLTDEAIQEVPRDNAEP
ncbi:hypothetical protein NM688_g5761 [Phlebia brevispora]|uniref:Uncharacterized protein n=1 Tax=Phlebia brevispora TaxID=194682 RepID=A0ACC1SQ83_9APHY|nr:hypothetical protein NM688_g5761 [Phlebia brevispora]